VWVPQLRAKLLEEAQIVFTTLNSSGQEFFARMAFGFHTVIIDEACQAVEASTLIPLLLDVRRCILVGEGRVLALYRALCGVLLLYGLWIHVRLRSAAGEDSPL